MSPSEYASHIVLPTVREFLSVLDDTRRAYLACIATFHLVDYVARAENVKASQIAKNMQKESGDDFDIVEGICNGSKHCGRDWGEYRHLPGSETALGPISYGSGFYGKGRYGGLPGLLVQHRGKDFLIDECLRKVLATFERVYSKHFLGISLQERLPR